MKYRLLSRRKSSPIRDRDRERHVADCECALIRPQPFGGVDTALQVILVSVPHGRPVPRRSRVLPCSLTKPGSVFPRRLFEVQPSFVWTVHWSQEEGASDASGIPLAVLDDMLTALTTRTKSRAPNLRLTFNTLINVTHGRVQDDDKNKFVQR